jgi:hypothetical protein
MIDYRLGAHLLLGAKYGAEVWSMDGGVAHGEYSWLVSSSSAHLEQPMDRLSRPIPAVSRSVRLESV